MTPELVDLARRLVARPEWRWADGMLALDSGGGFLGRCTQGDGDAGVVAQYDPRDMYGQDEDLPEYAVPDLTDDATAGCLLQMLRAAQPGAPLLLGGFDASYWAIEAYDLPGVSAPTLGEAAARALLACWEGA